MQREQLEPPAPIDLVASRAPLVAMHVYLDERGHTLSPHPGVRTSSPERYLECVVTQAASLRLQDAACEIALVSNIDDGAGLGRSGRRLWATLRSLEVEIVPSALRIDRSSGYGAARLLRDALAAAIDGQDAQRRLWLPNADCVWRDPARALQRAIGEDEVGCLVIDYPPDWSVGGAAQIGDTRRSLGATAIGLGGSERVPAWVGGDVLTGTSATLGRLREALDELDVRLKRDGPAPTTEQLLTLAGALGRVSFSDIAEVFGRIHTGARDRDAIAHARDLAIWHLPGEKGLSFRRAAGLVLRGGSARLGAQLADERRAARLFNVAPTRRARQLRDYSWLAEQKLRTALRRA